MKALHIFKYGRFPQLIELPLPKLKQNQFLVKMNFVPINPSDINFFQGFYGVRKQGTPIVGFQGAGTIIQTENTQSKHFIGRHVSVLANKSNGTYASHISSCERQLIIWPQNFNSQLNKLCMQWINPVSCIGLSNNLKNSGYQTVVLSAATSQLCKMTIKYIKNTYPKVKMIGFSRNPQFDQQLLKIGLSQVFRTTNEQAIMGLKQRKGNMLFLDCIGGEFAAKVFNSLTSNSKLVSYGRLSKSPLGNIDLGELYFRNKSIQGFWMNNMLQNITQQQLCLIKNQVINNFNHIFNQQIRRVYPFQQFMDAFKDSIKNASNGKILLSL